MFCSDCEVTWTAAAGTACWLCGREADSRESGRKLIDPELLEMANPWRIQHDYDGNPDWTPKAG